MFARLPQRQHCLKKLLCISCLEHKTHEWVRNNISFLVGPQVPFLATVKRRTHMVRACHSLRSTASPKPSLGEPWWMDDASWSAERILDVQCKIFDILLLLIIINIIINS